MPCYNCEATLKEAVDSIYAQKLTIPFEVVVVDDGSIDGTRGLIKQLADEYKEIKYILHKQNRGGGATRNAAVENSDGEVIFCLDSDDILGENCLQKMYDLLVEKKLDGVTISKSIKFLGNDINNVQYITKMDYIDEIIPFESLFDQSKQCGLYSTFMHTREAFKITGGYPTSHGFDTQEFAFAFLANGLRAMGCKNVIYHHRLSKENNSYYNREYKSGKVNYNWYKILEQYIYFFNDDIKEKILGFDVYRNIVKSHITDFLDSEDIFAKNHKALSIKNTKGNYCKILKNKDKLNKYEEYWLSVYVDEIDKKSLHLLKSISMGLNGALQYKRIFSYIESLNGDNIEDIYAKLKKDFVKQTLLVRIKNRINRLWSK